MFAIGQLPGLYSVAAGSRLSAAIDVVKMLVIVLSGSFSHLALTSRLSSG
jgi:hypothetical protein